MMERSKSTPDILSAIDIFEHHSSRKKEKTQIPFSHKIYNSGTLQSLQIRETSQLVLASSVGKSMYDVKSGPSTPELPQRQPHNHASTPEMIHINTGVKSSMYSNVSKDFEQLRKESHYESSFRPGIEAKLVNDPQGALLNPDQAITKNKALSNQNGDKNITFADERIMENAYKFMQKYPNASLLVTANIHSDKLEENKKQELYEPEPDYNDCDDENINEKANKLRNSSIETVEDPKLMTNIHEQKNAILESGNSINDNKTLITVISITSNGDKEANKQMAFSSSHSSPQSTNSSKHSPVPIRLQENTTLISPAQSLASSRRSSGIVMVTPSQLSSAGSSRRSSIQSNLSGEISDRSSNYYSLSSISTIYTSKSEESLKNELQTNVSPLCPPLPPPPPPLPIIIGTSSSRDGDANVTLRQHPNNINIASALPNRISKEDLLAAVVERQNRLELEGPRLSEIKTVPASKTTLELNQEALKAAVAKRKSRLEDTSLVNEIEARLNQNKKLQSAKYFGSKGSKLQDDNSIRKEEINTLLDQTTISALSKPKDEKDVNSVKSMDKEAQDQSSTQTSQIKQSPVVPTKFNHKSCISIMENSTNKIYLTDHNQSGGSVDFRAHLKHIESKVTSSANPLQPNAPSTMGIKVATMTASKVSSSKTSAPSPLIKTTSSVSAMSSSKLNLKPETELNSSSELKSDLITSLSGYVSQSGNNLPSSTVNVTLIERARLEYLKNETLNNLQPNIEKRGPVEITHKKSGQHGDSSKAFQVLPTNSPENSLSDYSSMAPTEKKQCQENKKQAPYVSIKDRINCLQIEKTAKEKVCISGVSEGHSQTEISLSTGNQMLKKPKSNSEYTPLPNKTRVTCVKLSSVPPQSGFSDSSATKPAVNELEPILTSCINRFSSTSRISISDMIVPPPPPPPPPYDMSDSTFGDEDEFIPPPPEFLEIDSNSNESKTMEKNFKPFLTKPISIWTCGDVLNWLEHLGLQQYITNFARASIDGTKLVEMGRKDFLNLGVSHSMILEQTVKKLNQSVSTNL